ncbi:MAG: sulfatase [Planctomycetota bacterium]
MHRGLIKNKAAAQPRSIIASFHRALWLVALTLLLSYTAHAGDRPNVLFILTEDQGQHLSYLNTPGLETPNMDRIASSGVYFTRAYCSYPVCSAAKAALFTGHYGSTTGLVDNTQNFFVPANKLTDAQRKSKVYSRIRIADRFPTLIEILKHKGYHLAVSGKLHLSPNEKFPYDEWFRVASRDRVGKMITAAKAADKPFFFLCNIQAPHRPYRNSDNETIGVDPSEVELPAFLPDTPVIRKDWAEYLDYCEVADQRIGAALKALEDHGVMDNTLIVLMGDHGPAYHRGKMSLYQFGLNVPLAFSGPGVPEGVKTDALFAGVDMMPTLLDLIGIKPAKTTGLSLADAVRGKADAKERKHVFGLIAHQAQLTDKGMQERSVFDGRWKLIFRNSTTKPRTVNSDLKYWLLELPDGRKLGWRNRVYDEIVKRKKEFPDAYRMLAEIDNKSLSGVLENYELYDTLNDPDEFKNLAKDPAHRSELRRLKAALRQWVQRTDGRFLDSKAIR